MTIWHLNMMIVFDKGQLLQRDISLFSIFVAKEIENWKLNENFDK